MPLPRPMIALLLSLTALAACTPADAASNKEEFQTILRERIALNQRLLPLLTGVKDAATAEAAVPEVRQTVTKLAQLRQRATILEAKLRNDEFDDKTANAVLKLETEAADLEDQIEEQARRIAAIPDAAKILDQAAPESQSTPVK